MGYFENYKVSAVVGKLTAHVYDLIVLEDYKDVRDRLFQRIADVPHMFFVFDSLLSGDFSRDYANDFYQPVQVIRDAVNSYLTESGISVLPYRRNAEVSVMAQKFLSETEDGLLFRIYVPSGRLWANEVDRLLQLFRDYLARIGHSAVRLDQARTARGIIYEFHGEPTAEESSLADEFRDFSKLLDLATTDPSKAEALLRTKDVKQREIDEILSRYSKEATRLKVDLRQERERKVMNIRHRCESELVDVFPAGTDSRVIEQLVDSVVPSPTHIEAALTTGRTPALLGSINAQSVTINLNPKIVEAVNAIVADEIQGDVHLNEFDQQLLALIREHGGERVPELVSDVHELADTSAPSAGRLLAKNRLKAFLLQLGSKATEIGVGLLQSYIEKQIGL